MLLTGGQTICRKLSEESMISVSRGSRSTGAARGREEGSNQNAERLQKEMESDFSDGEGDVQRKSQISTKMVSDVRFTTQRKGRGAVSGEEQR